MQRLTILGSILVATLAAGACGNDRDEASRDDAGNAAPGRSGEVVAIEQFAFVPARLEIRAGTTVQWQNEDAFLHTVTSGATSGPENIPDGRFDEDLPERASIADVTFDEPGTFTYYCKQHNAMDGTIVVS